MILAFTKICCIDFKKQKGGPQMRLIFIVGFLFLFIFSGQVLAEPIAKHLIDAEPGEALLIDVEQFFQAHPIEKGPARVETVFKSPRAQVMFIRLKGAPIGRHIHTQCDDLIYVYKGRGEIYLNGKWTPTKAGDFHTSPRGVAHSIRTAEDKEIWLIDFFSEPPPPGGDRAMID
ncbi:MAG: cupin domain-containing protein [Desulfobacterales bacterium]|nr:cupin domain-containing protein [Desulfobacterales bacterium]